MAVLSWSLPLWERGLKYEVNQILDLVVCEVAPLVGAWIEINLLESLGIQDDVAPLVGAWIEITTNISNIPSLTSLPLWERGLK